MTDVRFGMEVLEVPGDARGGPGVPGGLAVPAALGGVVAEGVDVVELCLQYRGVCGDEVVAVLADVRVGAGSGDRVAGAVAVREAGLEHLGAEPRDLVWHDRPPG